MTAIFMAVIASEAKQSSHHSAKHDIRSSRGLAFWVATLRSQ
jgi:hypothetical protein